MLMGVCCGLGQFGDELSANLFTVPGGHGVAGGSGCSHGTVLSLKFVLEIVVDLGSVNSFPVFG